MNDMRNEEGSGMTTNFKGGTWATVTVDGLVELRFYDGANGTGSLVVNSQLTATEARALAGALQESAMEVEMVRLCDEYRGQ